MNSTDSSLPRKTKKQENLISSFDNVSSSSSTLYQRKSKKQENSTKIDSTPSTSFPSYLIHIKNETILIFF